MSQVCFLEAKWHTCCYEVVLKLLEVQHVLFIFRLSYLVSNDKVSEIEEDESFQRESVGKKITHSLIYTFMHIIWIFHSIYLPVLTPKLA